MQDKVTLKDLSKLLNLSVSTISKALNNSREISVETREKVKNVAILKNYTPNRLAQSLKANRTKTIGVIIPDVLAHFFAKAVHGIETKASNYGYKVFICLSNESLQKEAESLETLIQGNVDGVIMSLARETQTRDIYDHFENAIRFNLPVVLFDRTTNRLICDQVSIDDLAAAKEATNYLIATGCKNVIFLSTIQGTSVGEKRNEGYRQAAKKAERDDFSLNIDDYSTFEQRFIEVLKNSNIDGIVAADELSAVSAMKYALKNNYKIPKELSVIGFTNGLLGENYIPSLTTVEQHAEEQGSLATKILIDRIEKRIPVEPVQEVLKTSIVERESTNQDYAKYI